MSIKIIPSMTKALAVVESYYSDDIRSFYKKIYDIEKTTSFKEIKREFFLWLLDTASSSDEEKKEIQEHIATIRESQKHLKEELEQLGGGNTVDGALYYLTYNGYKDISDLGTDEET